MSKSAVSTMAAEGLIESMTKWTTIVLSCVVGIFASACKDSKPKCVEGISVACTCSDGSAGAQVCTEKAGFAECSCGAAPVSADKVAAPANPAEAKVADAEESTWPAPLNALVKGMSFTLDHIPQYRSADGKPYYPGSGTPPPEKITGTVTSVSASEILLSWDVTGGVQSIRTLDGKLTVRGLHSFYGDKNPKSAYGGDAIIDRFYDAKSYALGQGIVCFQSESNDEGGQFCVHPDVGIALMQPSNDDSSLNQGCGFFDGLLDCSTGARSRAEKSMKLVSADLPVTAAKLELEPMRGPYKNVKELCDEQPALVRAYGNVKRDEQKCESVANSQTNVGRTIVHSKNYAFSAPYVQAEIWLTSKKGQYDCHLALKIKDSYFTANLSQCLDTDMDEQDFRITEAGSADHLKNGVPQVLVRYERSTDYTDSGGSESTSTKSLMICGIGKSQRPSCTTIVTDSEYDENGDSVAFKREVTVGAGAITVTGDKDAKYHKNLNGKHPILFP